MRGIASIIAFTSILLETVESLNMTVRATINPKASIFLPLCSITYLDTFQLLLTLWVTKATIPYIPDFTMPQGFFLTYYNPARRVRGLRGDIAGTEPRSLTTKTSPSSCTTCTSSGCSTYCGSGSCSLCGGSRRLNSDTTESRTVSDSRDNKVNEWRKLNSIDFVELGIQVSATVQALLQSYLLSQVGGLLGCLGDPLYLTANVTFLVNQDFIL